jgi:hypothetical protein
MVSQILVPQTLQNGFWPSLRFGLAVEDEFIDDGIVREGYTKDSPFVGCRHNCS